MKLLLQTPGHKLPTILNGHMNTVCPKGDDKSKLPCVSFIIMLTGIGFGFILSLT